MKKSILSSVVLWWPLLATSLAAATQPWHPPTANSGEMRLRDQWVKRYLQRPQRAAPFSFTYAERPSAEFLSRWPATLERRRPAAGRTESTRTWTDPASGLRIRCVAVEYADYPVVEWTVYFKNTGAKDTPLLEGVQGLDVRFERDARGEFVLNGIKGDFCTADSYEPYRLELTPGLTKRFSPPDYSGKSCDGPEGWPYYNLQTPEGGTILAVGWPGQWASVFARDAARGLRVQAGQQRTRLFLKPGEEIRTPLIALLFWQGDDTVRAQNLWRRWYLAHNLPRVRGVPQPPTLQIQVGGAVANIEDVKAFLAAGIKPDICWRDAGGAYTWYPNQNGPYLGNDAWLNTGTWEVDPVRYPQGFRPFSDWARSNGMQFLLWFEPERVGATNTWLARTHPDWLLPGTSHGALIDLGRPETLAWLTDHLDGLVKSQGLDWYREDMNGGGPLPAWRKHDTTDRQGLTENLYVQGHLALWDALRRRNPDLRIDSCASGGRRNDLESMRRAVPLLRSDFQFPDMKGVVEGNQGHTYGLSSWLPFQGTGVYLYDTYALRSFYLAGFGTGGLDPATVAAQKRAYSECARIAPLLLADYYPLTPYSLRTNEWIAWQFHRPEKGDGVVQAFRRSQCESPTLTVRLRGLNPRARYEVTDFDVPGKTVRTGAELLEPGLAVEVKAKPGAALLEYRLLPSARGARTGRP